MALRAGSKRKGKEPMRKESPPHFDHSSYSSLDAFNWYSTRNITFARIVNFTHLDFMSFNQLMRRLKWLTFARLSNPCYPSVIRRFYANLIRSHKVRLYLVATLGDGKIELDPSSLSRILGVNDDGDEVLDTNSWPIVKNFDPQQCLGCLRRPNS